MEAWTDDIPICRSAGIGTVNNEIYRKDGKRVEMHPMRCRYFTFILRTFKKAKIAQFYAHYSVYNLRDCGDKMFLSCSRVA